MPTLAEPRRRMLSLNQLSRGQTGVIREANLDVEDAAHLRAMGLRPDATIRVCRLGQPCIVELCDHCGTGCRIGLAPELASKVFVHVD